MMQKKAEPIIGDNRYNNIKWWNRFGRYPYYTPTAVSDGLTVWSYNILDPYGVNLSRFSNGSVIKVFRNGVVIATYMDDEVRADHILSDLSEGTYTIYYNIKLGTTVAKEDCEATYRLSILANKHPLKRWTCTDVINRLLDLAEPLQLGQKPRFSLNEEQAAAFDKIYCPEMTFTRQTLREQLQEVGKVLHAEPRLRTKEDGSKEIYYDLYGGKELSPVRHLPYMNKAAKHMITYFCSSVDSSAENLVNQLDWKRGVIVEPYASGYKTVRAETKYTRITDENMIISTDRPIYQVVKLECGILPDGVGDITYADITKYVFESTLYSSQLSSYVGTYPYSKAFGLYYTQGQKNIRGLNFKESVYIFDELNQYAILNILEEATGKEITVTDTMKTDFYPRLAFRVTYIPFFNVRVGQSKPYYKDYDRSAVIAYNQQANVIETRYYGENIKGAVARLGNVEKSITFLADSFKMIPKAGELYDEDYYISAVSTEVYPTLIKCTIGLSKDFNRISQYIGISSNRRYYEVSERQAYDRSVLYKEYVVIGDKETEKGNGITNLGAQFMKSILWMFGWNAEELSPVTSVVAWGGTYNNPVAATVDGETVSPLACVRLPVVSCALGNSIVFIWSYEDNYSAGSVSTYAKNGDVSGYFQDDYPYTDYYGRMYYYNFDLQSDGEAPADFDGQAEIGLSLPRGTMPSQSSGIYSTMVSKSPYILRKDNREILQVNASVEFVTNRKGYIIGSALAARNSLVTQNGKYWKDDDNLIDRTFARLYFLQKPLGKFTSSLLAEGIDIDDPNMATQEYFMSAFEGDYENARIQSFTIEKDCKAWAFVTPIQKTTETVEDEQGNVTEQVITTGGELLFGCNGDFKAGDKVDDIYFSPIHGLYKDSLNRGVIFEFSVLRKEWTEGTKYSFAFGMKWSEWVASSYNTDGYYISNGMVKRIIGSYVYTLKEGDNDDGKTVLSTDTVKRGYYFLYLSGIIV